MTDAEWLSSDDATAMLHAVRPQATDRRLRLIAAACCRHLGRRLDHPAASSAIEGAIVAVERFADGAGTKAALKRARQAVRGVRHARSAAMGGVSPAWCALWVAEVAASENACWSVVPEIDRLAGLGLLGGGGRPPMCDWIRCVFGPPSHAGGFDPAWRRPEIMGLASAIAEREAFEVIGQLGQALRMAGCEDPCMLGHCDPANGHVRGCWVVDAVLDLR